MRFDGATEQKSRKNRGSNEALSTKCGAHLEIKKVTEMKRR